MAAAAGNFQPDMRNAGVGAGLIAGVLVLIWLATGFFIVQEGQQAVITQFGKYKTTVGARASTGVAEFRFNATKWYFVTQIRSVDVGRDTILKASRVCANRPC